MAAKVLEEVMPVLYLKQLILEAKYLDSDLMSIELDQYFDTRVHIQIH